MNKYQRIVLIVGAIAFAAVLLTAPKHIVSFEGLKIKDDFVKDLEARSERGESLNSTQESLIHSPLCFDLTTAIIRGIAVLGTTVLLYFAVGGIKQKTRGTLAEQSVSPAQGDLFGYIQAQPVQRRPIFFPKRKLGAQIAKLQTQVDELKDNIEANESQIAELQERMEEISRIVNGGE